MTIEKKQNGTSYTLTLSGRLDTTTAPQLEAELATITDKATELFLDFEKLDYISSAGLRVLLVATKIMNKRKGLIIKNVNASIMEIFNITGFVNILTIK